MPATMSSCLNSCGDCGNAYQLPGCNRTGTKKSRAPSGVERVNVGVSISMKSSSMRILRAIWLTCERIRRISPALLRRRSRYRCRNRTSSLTIVRSSMGKGSGADLDSTSRLVVMISIAPEGKSGFALPPGLCSTVPVTAMQYSSRKSCAMEVSRTTT